MEEQSFEPDDMDLDSLQAAVGKWHRKMFGSELRPLRLLVPERDKRGSCLQEEADELVEAESIRATSGLRSDEEWCQEEAADVGLIILAYADRLGFSLLDAMRRKFDVNRSRPRERVLR